VSNLVTTIHCILHVHVVGIN